MDDRARRKDKRKTLTEQTTSAIWERLEGRGARVFLPFFGPAVVVSIAYMDPGNFATNIQAGAKYGYTLLWVVLLANLIAMLFQALSAKLGIVTPRHNLVLPSKAQTSMHGDLTATVRPPHAKVALQR